MGFIFIYILEKVANNNNITSDMTLKDMTNE